MAEGYDGIYISDTLADHGSRDYESSHWWLVFDPKNIKSIFAKEFRADSADLSEEEI
jgi:antirestriction protein